MAFSSKVVLAYMLQMTNNSDSSIANKERSYMLCQLGVN